MSDHKSTRSAEQKVETAVVDTFPASDPSSATAAAGSRAVDPADMMHAAGSQPEGATSPVAARFPDREAAKLAVEKVVREGPLDRRRAEITTDDDGAVVEVQATPADAHRVADLLTQEGGQRI
ncbi:hypothetical protein M0638_19025 [Roseomonas sp. NAR14]|uniref:Uncharacterized protein n=1 Tax=Roseomonas acroporae TaxID=2937791 RepID=A0A9X1YC57_9PROT|nr:hypothetical protein [Roseomonas acroporae]MCK8786473.1 hypothetical protein [Roseomonas acroporae]